MLYHFGILGCVISIARQGGRGNGEGGTVKGEGSTDNSQQTTEEGRGTINVESLELRGGGVVLRF